MTRTLFDKSTVYNAQIAPLINRFNQICAKHEIPVFISATVAAFQKDDNTDFSMLSSIGGNIIAMPIEQMIGAAITNPVFMEALQAAHARFLLALITMPPEYANSDQYRADFRGATAYVAAHNMIERAKERLHEEAEAVRGMSGFFQAMMNEAIARTDHPELFVGDELDAPSLPPEYMDFIDTLFKGKSNG